VRYLHIVHHGAQHGVTGSCHQVHRGAEHSLLVHCGPSQGDHVGHIPCLRAAGYKGPIFSSKPSTTLLPIALITHSSSASVVTRIQERSI